MSISISAAILMWMFTVVMVLSGNNSKDMVMVASDVMDDIRHDMVIFVSKLENPMLMVV